MPYTNVGNKVGTSKSGGLLKKYESENSDMKLLQFGDFLKGSEPFTVKDINTGEPVSRDAWVRMYLNNSSIAAKKRIEDTARISKFVASPRGVLWEADMAALEAIQKNSKTQQQKRIQRIQEGGKAATEGEGFWQSLGSNLLSTVVNLGKSALQGIGLTAATLTQVAASGTGFHNDTYISRAYLTDSSSTLNQILSYAGITTGEGISGAAKVLGGATDILGKEPWTKLSDENKLVPEYKATVSGSRPPVQTYGTRDPGSSASNFVAGLNGLLQSQGLSTPIGPAVNEVNYEGERISSGSRFSDNELHGVSTVKKSSAARRAVDSRVRTADSKSLNSRYGTVQGRTEKDDNLEGNEEATTVARDYERADLKYLKGTSVGTGKSGEVPYRVDTNLDTGSVKSLYSFEEPKQYLNGEEWEKRESPQEGKEIVTIKVGEGSRRLSGLSRGLRYSKDAVEEFTYGVGELRELVSRDPDLHFNKKKLSESLGLIPFCITTITPDHRTYLNFPAFLDSYEDSYTGEWDSVRYVGRAENFYGYKGFSRSISLSFKVIARNFQQLEPLYRKLNKLVGATAPSYDPRDLFMRGTLASLTIGGWHEGALLKEKLGFIPSVKLSWESDIPWEINFEDEALKNTNYRFVVPHALNVSMTFTPIEDQEPREDYDAYFVFDPKQKAAHMDEPEQVEAPEEPVRDVRKRSLPEPQQMRQPAETLGDKNGQELYRSEQFLRRPTADIVNGR